MQNKNNIVIGIIFVALGLLFLLKNLNVFDIFDIFDMFNVWGLVANLWPTLFLLIPSFIMHMSFFSGRNRDAGILVPGGILFGVGVTLQLTMLFGIANLVWPGYIMAVAIGLFELYMFGNRDKGLLVPVIILGGLSTIFFITNFFNEVFGFGVDKLFIPLILILLGVAIIFKSDRKNKGF